LDGVLFKHGLIVFITTNHPEKLDPALLRQGRTDMIIQFTYPTRSEIEKMFRDMIGKYYSSQEETSDAFKNFYDKIKDRLVSMSAIVNFLFRYKEKHMTYLSDLIDGDTFIKTVTGEETSSKLYT
jgi:chaperone BCS1